MDALQYRGKHLRKRAGGGGKPRAGGQTADLGEGEEIWLEAGLLHMTTQAEQGRVGNYESSIQLPVFVKPMS